MVTFILSIGLADNLSDAIPDKIEYFKVGDVLNPDYAIQDTLIVINANELNKVMAAIEQGYIENTRGEIAALFYANCKIK